MFFTPGWAAILTLGGTLGGVTLTQAVNSAISWRSTRKEQRSDITKAVSELIANSQSWIYAASTQEQDLFRAVATRVPEHELQDTLERLRADVYAAQLAFGSSIALVRVTCPPKVVAAAENVHRAVQGFENDTRAKGGAALRVRSVDGIDGTNPAGVVGPVDNLVDVTRKAIGVRKRRKG